MEHESEIRSKQCERFSVESVYNQGVGAFNEDALVIKGNTFGVFDGATSLDGWKNQAGETGGFLASRISEEVAENAREEMTPRELLLVMNEQLAKAMCVQAIDTTKKSNRWALTAALIKMGDGKFEWAQIGDSTILVIYKDGSVKTLGDDTDFDVPLLVLWQSLPKTGNLKFFQREEMREQIIKVREQSNVNYGFLNGEVDAEKFIASGEELLEHVAAILLFTDGLTIPKTDPGTPNDIETIKNFYLEGGLEKVKNYVRGLEESDPKCATYIRFKKHDDIAAIAVQNRG